MCKKLNGNLIKINTPITRISIILLSTSSFIFRVCPIEAKCRRKDLDLSSFRFSAVILFALVGFFVVSERRDMLILSLVPILLLGICFLSEVFGGLSWGDKAVAG